MDILLKRNLKCFCRLLLFSNASQSLCISVLLYYEEILEVTQAYSYAVLYIYWLRYLWTEVNEEI